VKLQSVEVRRPIDLAGAVGTMRGARAEAALVLTSTMLPYHWPDLARQLLSDRLPAVREAREFAESGGLLSYGLSAADQRARAVGVVDDLVRRLRRERPAAPAVPAVSTELVVNLTTARVLGLTIPPSLLARAATVIDEGRRSR
jgi:putative ABC transport system substrate-binding protein